MFQETQKALAIKSEETDRKFQETQKALAKQAEETDRKIQEAADQIK